MPVRVRSMEGLGVWLSKQIDICSFDELRRLNAKPSHERVRFTNANFTWLILFENNLKLQELTKLFDTVEVYASSAKKVQGSALHDSTDFAIGETQGFTQTFRAWRWSTNVERLLWTVLIRSAIEDEFAFCSRKSTEFQAT